MNDDLREGVGVSWIVLVVQTVVHGILSMVVAHSKNRNVNRWFTVGLLCGILGFVVTSDLGTAFFRVATYC